MNIVGLGYLGLYVPDVAEWTAFASDVIGLDRGIAPREEPWVLSADSAAGDASAYFRIDEWTWRLAVHPVAEGFAPGLAYVGLEVAGPQELDQALAELAAAGFEARRGGAADCRARAVSGIGFTRDPGGHVVELFYGPQKDHGYRNSRGMDFLTGALGMGHINLFASSYEASRAFWCEVMGFRLTDYYAVGPDQVVSFFHINPRHHTVGLMNVAPNDAIHHLMFEMRELDMVGLAYDRAKAAGCKITVSLGRHSNDRIVSFYMQSPSGVEVEIGWDALTVGPDWTPCYRAPGDIWGHHGLTAEAIAETGSQHERSTNSRNGRPLSEGVSVRRAVGKLAAEIETAKMLQRRVVDSASKGGMPAIEAAMYKVFATRLQQVVTDFVLDRLGPTGLLRKGAPGVVDGGGWEHFYQTTPLDTIGGGTSEVQKNIIARRHLGLPLA